MTPFLIYSDDISVKFPQYIRHEIYLHDFLFIDKQ